MSGNAQLVMMGAPDMTIGGVQRGPLGTALPTSSAGAPNAAIKNCGFISEDGLTYKTSVSTTNVKDWNQDVVKVLQTEHLLELEFAYLETNEMSLKGFFGPDNVTMATSANEDTIVKVNGTPLPLEAYVFNIKDGSNRIRIVLPMAQVTAPGELKFTKTEPIKWPVTVTPFPDKDGNKAYIYINGLYVPTGGAGN